MPELSEDVDLSQGYEFLDKELQRFVSWAERGFKEITPEELLKEPYKTLSQMPDCFCVPNGKKRSVEKAACWGLLLNVYLAFAFDLKIQSNRSNHEAKKRFQLQDFSGFLRIKANKKSFGLKHKVFDLKV
jgi:hypothetical protein